jgi:perosamine synthetase
MDPKTLGPDEQFMRQVPAGSAVCVVHTVGCIVDVEALATARPDLILLEDACEAFPVCFQNRPVIPQVLAAAVSFFGNKTVTCGEGGALLFLDKALADAMRHCCKQGMTSKRYVHDVLAYNYRLSNLNCALLLAQLEDLETVVRLKRQVFALYDQLVQDSGSKQLHSIESRALWMYPVRIRSQKFPTYEAKEAEFRKWNIEVRPYFYPASAHPHVLERIRGDRTIGNIAHHEVVILPSFPELTPDEQRHIVAVAGSM